MRNLFNMFIFLFFITTVLSSDVNLKVGPVLASECNYTVRDDDEFDSISIETREVIFKGSVEWTLQAGPRAQAGLGFMIQSHYYYDESPFGGNFGSDQGLNYSPTFYGLVRYFLMPESDNMYIIGNFGINNYYDSYGLEGFKDTSWEDVITVENKGGLYYGCGLGLEFYEGWQFELMYTINNGKDVFTYSLNSGQSVTSTIDVRLNTFTIFISKCIYKSRK